MTIIIENTWKRDNEYKCQYDFKYKLEMNINILVRNGIHHNFSLRPDIYKWIKEETNIKAYKYEISGDEYIDSVYIKFETFDDMVTFKTFYGSGNIKGN